MTKQTLKFTKMAGAGNDFIIIDAVKGLNVKKIAVKACDRTNGIGADGLIIIDKSKTCDFKMRIINADGSEAEMCGNGARCFAAFLVANKRTKKDEFSFETLAGPILGSAKGETACVRLTDPIDHRSDIEIDVNDRNIKVDYIDTGVPHVMVFVHDLPDIDVKTIGHTIRFHKAFKPRGSNVNFVEYVDDKLVAARTYERGVEDETKACGTGSVACALIAYLKLHPNVQNKKRAKMKVRTTGGEILQVTFDINNNTISNVWLKGSAKFIAKGEYYV